MATERELALAARAWPFEEARKLLARLDGGAPEKGCVVFETGYGPSGLPHAAGTRRRPGTGRRFCKRLPISLNNMQLN